MFCVPAVLGTTVSLVSVQQDRTPMESTQDDRAADGHNIRGTVDDRDWCNIRIFVHMLHLAYG